MKLVAVALLLGSVLAADWSITRRSDVTFDGTKLTLVEGEDREMPCGHSPGKTHRVRVDQAKTYQFNGLGAHFDFDSTMSIHVDSTGQSSVVRIVHPSGSHFVLQVFDWDPEGDVLDRWIESILTTMSAKDVVRKSAKIVVAGEELEAVRIDGPTFGPMKMPISLQFFWKPLGKGGLMGCFGRLGQNADEGGLATIEKSLRFDKK